MAVPVRRLESGDRSSPVETTVGPLWRCGVDSSISWHTTGVTYVLFLVFGIGSWLTVNGLFTELPLLVTELPEGWRLASMIAVVVQLGNLGPVLFLSARWCLRTRRRRLLGQDGDDEIGEACLATGATYCILALGALAMATMAAAWPEIASHHNSGHSVVFLALCFVAALADCTSSMLFWRFVGAFRPVHVSALAAGEGMSGVVTSGVAWIQGASRPDPAFSAATYFVLLATAMCASAGAYCALHCSRAARAERWDVTAAGARAVWAGPGVRSLGEEESCADGDRVRMTQQVGVVWLLMLQALISSLQNGVSVSCLALACKPYGRTAYQSAQTVSLLIDPLAAAIGFGVSVGSWSLLVVTAVFVLCHGYVLLLSLDAIAPPLLGVGGGTFLICVAGVGRALTAYAKMRANVMLSEGCGFQGEAEARLMWSGAAMQGGSCSGASVMYLLINFTPFFRSAS
eukprot:gnl/TRDRNA2_/TRDRNA2_128593_c0_seq1.p1 gnl/TRDRNA2_/TRDRNA2_128593_c0~~gnl/TRDRNA2_/TRDRNA2_128593_c0_seq1.p1  ORF type:complete len:459 (-),score=46.17 gnl/TRDRNA2_/TRDRNA2_128593_c0_seq1:185-1561(-)